MNITPEQFVAIRETLLTIFWAKDDITKFFAENGCSQKDLGKLGKHGDSGRPWFIDIMLNHLQTEGDRGFEILKSMIVSLMKWDKFDSYYFRDLKKLNETDALEAIAKLKELERLRLEDSKVNRTALKKDPLPADIIEDITPLLDSIFMGNISDEEKVANFTELLETLIRNSTAEQVSSFKCHDGMITGTIKFNKQNYSVAAKWQLKSGTNKPLKQFAAKMQSKGNSRGFFISINGFSNAAQKALEEKKQTHTKLISGKELQAIIKQEINFTQLLKSKVD